MSEIEGGPDLTEMSTFEIDFCNHFDMHPSKAKEWIRFIKDGAEIQDPPEVRADIFEMVRKAYEDGAWYSFKTFCFNKKLPRASYEYADRRAKEWRK